MVTAAAIRFASGRSPCQATLSVALPRSAPRPVRAHDGVDAATGVGGTFGPTSQRGTCPTLMVPQQNNVVRGIDYEVLDVMDIAAR